jgi:hypothetical protein
MELDNETGRWYGPGGHFPPAACPLPELSGPLITAILLAYLINPLATFATKKIKIPWRLSVTIIYLLLVLIILGLMTWGGFALVEQIQNLIRFIERNIFSCQIWLRISRNKLTKLARSAFHPPDSTGMRSPMRSCAPSSQPLGRWDTGGIHCRRRSQHHHLDGVDCFDLLLPAGRIRRLAQPVL